MWKPENYGKKFYGPSTLRVGLEKSRNLMTVRIAQNLGVEKIVNFSKALKIYDNPEELLSISLGSAETTLLKLTSAYSVFVNGGKLVEPILIDRIQDSEGNTIFNNDKRKCINCDQISYLGEDYPNIQNNYKRIFSLAASVVLIISVRYIINTNIDSQDNQTVFLVVMSKLTPIML